VKAGASFVRVFDQFGPVFSANDVMYVLDRKTIVGGVGNSVKRPYGYYILILSLGS
jgi:hypothetical protein